MPGYELVPNQAVQWSELRREWGWYRDCARWTDLSTRPEFPYHLVSAARSILPKYLWGTNRNSQGFCGVCAADLSQPCAPTHAFATNRIDLLAAADYRRPRPQVPRAGQRGALTTYRQRSATATLYEILRVALQEWSRAPSLLEIGPHDPAVDGAIPESDDTAVRFALIELD